MNMIRNFFEKVRNENAFESFKSGFKSGVKIAGFLIILFVAFNLFQVNAGFSALLIIGAFCLAPWNS